MGFHILVLSNVKSKAQMRSSKNIGARINFTLLHIAPYPIKKQVS